MLSPDRGIRNLLPILDEEPDEVVLIADSDGIRVRSTAGAETSTSQALHHGIDPAMPESRFSASSDGCCRSVRHFGNPQPRGVRSFGQSERAPRVHGKPWPDRCPRERRSKLFGLGLHARALLPVERHGSASDGRRWTQSTTGRTLLSRVSIRASKRTTEMVRNPARHWQAGSRPARECLRECQGKCRFHSLSLTETIFTSSRPPLSIRTRKCC